MSPMPAYRRRVPPSTLIHTTSRAPDFGARGLSAPEERFDARDVAAALREVGRFGELAGRGQEAEGQQALTELAQPVGQLHIVELSQLGGLHASSLRTTNRVLIGS